MPEDQNVIAEYWNSRLNYFLNSVLGWQQLGESNTDIYCEALKRKVGIDSVFSYHRNPAAHQQVVFVEAKTVEKIETLSRSKIEGWVSDFTEKIACVPHSPDFVQKYQPDVNANYQQGLLGLWVRDVTGYSADRLRAWLSQLNLPTRRQNPIDIVFISNRTISAICTIHQTIQSLSSSGAYGSLSYHFPTHGDLPPADGRCIPIEALLSKFLFCTGTRTQVMKGTRDIHSYPSNVTFYTGRLETYNDLRFIGLALKRFQLLSVSEIDIYTHYSPVKIRNEIKTFANEFAETGCKFDFHEQTISDALPGWLAQ